MNWKRVLPGLVVSVIALAVVFYVADLKQLVSEISKADYRLVAAAWLLSFLWLVVRSVFWRTLLQEKADLGEVFITVNEGYLLNNILPFRLGEIGRAFLLSQKTPLRFLEVLSTILVERVMDLAVAVGLVLSTLALVVGASWAVEAVLGVGAVVVIGFVILYLLARNRDWAISIYDRLENRWEFLSKLGRERIESFFDGLVVLKDGKRFLRAVIWLGLNWTIGILLYYILLLAFFPETEFLWAAFTLGVAAIGIAAPSSPAAVGVFELVIVGALTIFGLNPTTAFAFGITAHFIQISLTGVIGTYGLLRDGISLGSLYMNLYKHSRESPQNTV